MTTNMPTATTAAHQVTEPALADVARQLEVIGQLLSTIVEVTTAMDGRLRDLDRRVGSLESRPRVAATTAPDPDTTAGRLELQTAAVEQRVERVERAVAASAATSAAERQDVLARFEEEHRRVRARTSMLSSYEERLWRLEQR